MHPLELAQRARRPRAEDRQRAEHADQQRHPGSRRKCRQHHGIVGQPFEAEHLHHHIPCAAQPEREWEAIVVDRRGPQATLLIPDLAYDLPLTSSAPVGSVIKLRLSDVNLPALGVRAKL